MELNLYSVYDEVMNIYNNPYYASHEREAIRTLRNAAMDTNSQLNKSSQDYSLYFVATYDNETGQFINITPPQLVIRVTQLLNSIQTIPTTITNEEKNNA